LVEEEIDLLELTADVRIKPGPHSAVFTGTEDQPR
jgi:hypothetical protein